MIRARVSGDKATRIVELTVEVDGPEWDLVDSAATWRKMDRTFRPDRVRVVLSQVDGDWEVDSVRVSGQLLLKSGVVSTHPQSRDSTSWVTKGWGEPLSEAPPWVQDIAKYTPHGGTSYVWDKPASEAGTAD
jgi:hypothetical protein